MQLISQHIDKDESGSVTLRPQEDEDFWHAYNLIQEGDALRASAIRRVTNESSTGSSSSHRVHVTLTIQVNKVVYSAQGTGDAAAATSSSSTSAQQPAAAGGGAAGAGAQGISTHGGSTSLHISGPVVSENEAVKKGAFHTLDLDLGRTFTLYKGPGAWDSLAREQLREMCEPGRGAEVGAIVCGQGVANVCLVTNHTTIVRQRLDVSIPRKRKGGGAQAGAEKAEGRFLQQVYDAALRHFDFTTLKVIIIASPGFTKDAVMSHFLAEATRTGNKSVLTARSKFLLLHADSHHVHSLSQVLASPEVASQLKNTKFAREGQMLEKFFKMMENDPLRAWYGEGHVLRAADRGAISKLLISDEIFRSPDPTRRKRFVKLTEDVKAYGGEVFIFSSMHESGQQLNQLTGIAALLNYPLDIEVVEEEERQEREEAQQAQNGS